MKTSIIIPVYNSAEHLEECLDSVVRQSCGDFEAICVDDGSCDESLRILERYAASDDRFRIVAQRNAGVSAARNRGLAEARGDYVLFVDSDDLVEPNLLSDVVRMADELQADMTVFGFWEFYEQNGASLPREMCEEASIVSRAVSLGDVGDALSFELLTPNVWRILYRRSFIEGRRLAFHEDLMSSEDLAFIYEGLFACDRIVFVPRRYYRYRRDERPSITHGDRGLDAIVALDRIRRCAERNGMLTENNVRHFVNLVLVTVNYAIYSASSYGEMVRLFECFQSALLPYVRCHEDRIAPQCQGHYENLSRADFTEYFFDLYRGYREGFEHQLAAARDFAVRLEDAERARAQVESELESTVSSRTFRMACALMRPLSAVKRLVTRR